MIFFDESAKNVIKKKTISALAFFYLCPREKNGSNTSLSLRQNRIFENRYGFIRGGVGKLCTSNGLDNSEDSDNAEHLDNPQDWDKPEDLIYPQDSENQEDKIILSIRAIRRIWIILRIWTIWRI